MARLAGSRSENGLMNAELASSLVASGPFKVLISVELVKLSLVFVDEDAVDRGVLNSLALSLFLLALDESLHLCLLLLLCAVGWSMLLTSESMSNARFFDGLLAFWLEIDFVDELVDDE